MRGRLLARPGRRPQPARDDKVVAAWNGLAITALAEYARCSTGDADVRARTRRSRLAEAAGATRHLVDGRLRRVSRDGVVGEPAGVLEDYGCVAEAFCAVHQLTGDGRWLDAGRASCSTWRWRTSAPAQGGFYDTADDAERLVTRPADPTDNATPSGLSAIGAALVAYAALTGETRYREAAEAALATVAPLIVAGTPRFAGYAAAVGGGAAVRPVRDRDRRPPTRPAIRWSRPRTGTPRPAPWWSPASPTGPACRCWRTARWSAAARRRTSAGVSSATAR